MAYVQDLWYNVLRVVTAKDPGSFSDTGTFTSESGGNEKGEDDEEMDLAPGKLPSLLNLEVHFD